MPQNESPAGALKMSRRIRRTPYTGRVESAGVRGFTVTNHMLLPKAYGNDMTRDDNPQFVAWGPNANAMPPDPIPLRPGHRKLAARVRAVTSAIAGHSRTSAAMVRSRPNPAGATSAARRESRAPGAAS